MANARTTAEPFDLQPAAPTRSGRLLILIRTLIDFGTGLGRAVQNLASPPAVASVPRRFGTQDDNAIVARIFHALRLVGEPEHRIIKSARSLNLPRPQPAAPEPGQPRTAPPDRLLRAV